MCREFTEVINHGRNQVISFLMLALHFPARRVAPCWSLERVQVKDFHEVVVIKVRNRWR